MAARGVRYVVDLDGWSGERRCAAVRTVLEVAAAGVVQFDCDLPWYADRPADIGDAQRAMRRSAR